MLQAVGNLAASVLGGLLCLCRKTHSPDFGSLSFALGYGGVVLTSSPAAITYFLSYRVWRGHYKQPGAM